MLPPCVRDSMDRIQLMEQASKTVSDVLNFFRDKTVSDVLDPDS
jgi:hypothetical protein